MNALSCRDVVKKFGDYTALNSVSIEAKKGTIFGLLGPNGAGKTTLIRVINQIILPDSGAVSFYDHPLDKNDIYKIGYLPEERGLYKKMKVGEQAMYLARLKGLSHSQATKELRMWFEKFGIQGWWNKKVEELSKGMAQKVQFITTVLHKPQLLILDEPFSGFDPVNVKLIRDEILKMKEDGTTIILSTHNMESVEELCDDIALINKANLIAKGGLTEIRRTYGSNQVEVVYHGSDARPLNFPGYSTLISDQEHKGNRRAVLELLGNTTPNAILAEVIKSVEVISFQELIPRMNDIFIKLVRES